MTVVVIVGLLWPDLSYKEAVSLQTSSGIHLSNNAWEVLQEVAFTMSPCIFR